MSLAANRVWGVRELLVRPYRRRDAYAKLARDSPATNGCPGRGG